MTSTRRRSARLLAGALLATIAVSGAGATIAYAANGTNEVTIDAAKDTAGAQAAMSLFPASTDQSFTPTGQPKYTQTDWTPASTSSVNNPPDAKDPVKSTVTVTHTAASSWSVGGSVSASYGLKALGFANAEVSMKFSAEHEWTTENTDAEKVTATALPGKVVWIVASHTEVTFSGDYTFTANGTTYHVDNVTITEPAADPASGGDVHASTTYAAVEKPYSTVYAGTPAAQRPTGLVPLARTPQLRTLTAALPALSVGK